MRAGAAAELRVRKNYSADLRNCEASLKTLLILRHAKSSWLESGLADHDRPLNKRGQRDAPRMGRLLRQEDLVPDLIISSSAVRASKTAQQVIEESGYEGELRLERELYASEPEAYLDILQLLPDEVGRVMVVGHNPGLEELLELLTGDWRRLPTAALAQVSLDLDVWQDLSEETRGKLVNLWLPRQIAD
jgi:phosphohistidine phosphatase